MFIADAYVPGIFFAQVEPQRVGANRNTESDIAIAKQHAFKKVGRRSFAYDRMLPGKGKAIQLPGYPGK
jgi:hypothetical protein